MRVLNASPCPIGFLGESLVGEFFLVANVTSLVESLLDERCFRVCAKLSFLRDVAVSILVFKSTKLLKLLKFKEDSPLIHY